jgi:hypothetical protein
LDQINFIVPAGVEGCAVPVVVQTDYAFSNYVTMAISADGAACSPIAQSRDIEAKPDRRVGEAAAATPYQEVRS